MVDVLGQINVHSTVAVDPTPYHHLPPSPRYSHKEPLPFYSYSPLIKTVDEETGLVRENNKAPLPDTNVLVTSLNGSNADSSHTIRRITHL